VWEIIQELKEDSVDFIGYWEWPVNDHLPAGVYATLYRQSELALMVVSNLGEEEKTVTLDVDQLRKVFPRLRDVTDAEAVKSDVKSDGAQVQFVVGSKDFRLLKLK